MCWLLRPAMWRPTLSPLLLAAFLLWIFSTTMASKPLLESTSPLQDEAYYRGGVIKCRDRSGKFTRDQLNDVFYDCPDGTDEPDIAEHGW